MAIWKNRGPEWLSDWATVTQLLGCGVKIWTKAVWPQILLSTTQYVLCSLACFFFIQHYHGHLSHSVQINLCHACFKGTPKQRGTLQNSFIGTWGPWLKQNFERGKCMRQFNCLRDFQELCFRTQHQYGQHKSLRDAESETGFQTPFLH